MQKYAYHKGKQVMLLWAAVAFLAILAACDVGASPAGSGEGAPADGPVVEETASPPPGEGGGGLIEQVVSPIPEMSTVQVDTSQAPDLGEKAHKGEACPGLDSALYQITQSPDPIALALKVGMKARDGKIQVTLTLNGTDAAFLTAFDAEVGTQVGSRVQAYVPVDRLCEIAARQEVLRVSPAAIGVAQ